MEKTPCDTCGSRDATQVVTRIINGAAKPIYLCSVCTEVQEPERPATFDQPCEKCRQAEGRVKMVQIVNGRRRVSFLCNSCALRK